MLKSVLRLRDPWSIAMQALGISLTGGSMLVSVINGDAQWHCALLGAGFGFAIGTVAVTNLWYAKFQRHLRQTNNIYEMAVGEAHKIAEAQVETQVEADRT